MLLLDWTLWSLEAFPHPQNEACLRSTSLLSAEKIPHSVSRASEQKLSGPAS